MVESASIALHARRRPPWLRLVRTEPEDLGPVSPELVLVDPTLATAVRTTPDVVVVQNGAEKPSAPVPRPAVCPPATGTPSRYDTPDLLLERHGLELELTPRGSQRFWQLTAARGEQVVVLDDGAGVPAQIESLLGAVVREQGLVAVPARTGDPEIRRLEARLSKQRDSLLRHDVGTRIASDPESLHQVRVAARRVRAFLHVASDLVDDEWAADIDQGMRELGRGSNKARDVDVLLENMRTQIGSLDLRDRSAGEALISRLQADRDELQRAVVATLTSEGYQRVLDQLALPVVPAEGRPERKLDKLAARELRRLVARVRRLGKRPPEEALHALRIRVKRVRYATELASGPKGKKKRRVVDAATRMQDVLGAHHDAVVTEERLREMAHSLDETGIAFVAGRLAERERTKREEIHERLPAHWKELRGLARKLEG
jgi:CHAD domain-containing protein